MASASSRSQRSPFYSSHASTSSQASLKNQEDKFRTSTTRNPISLRLHKVLATNYDDPATREALQTLSDAYGHRNDPRQSGSDEAGTSEVSGASAAEKLIAGSGIAARARKNLRRDAEIKLAQSTQQFLRAFKEVDSVRLHPNVVIEPSLINSCKKLDVLQEHIDAMSSRCDEAQSQLQSTNEDCKSLLERAGGLRSAGYVREVYVY